MSGRGYARLIPERQRQGYDVKLVFLKLASVDLAIARVAARVAQGGHGVPESCHPASIHCRLAKLQPRVSAFVNRWMIDDNSGERAMTVEAGGT